MGGWFRKEIKSLADIKGLKFRIGGFGGKVFDFGGTAEPPGARLPGTRARSTRQVGRAVYDEKLRFFKVAKNYYYPGWWEPGSTLSLYVNIKAWDALPPVQGRLRIRRGGANDGLLAGSKPSGRAAASIKAPCCAHIRVT
jgi:TRAP-type mannitol/chloroaromatic compound transport system substrate-binding protein